LPALETPRRPLGPDVPGDLPEALVAVAQLQVAERRAAPVRLDAGVDDAVADAELARGLDGRSPLARAIVALTNSTTNAAIRVVVFVLPSFLKAEPPSALSQDNR